MTATIIISLFLAGVIFFIIRSMIKNKKQGKTSCGCGCGCGSCPMGGCCCGGKTKE